MVSLLLSHSTTTSLSLLSFDDRRDSIQRVFPAEVVSLQTRDASINQRHTANCLRCSFPHPSSSPFIISRIRSTNPAGSESDRQQNELMERSVSLTNMLAMSCSSTSYLLWPEQDKAARQLPQRSQMEYGSWSLRVLFSFMSHQATEIVEHPRLTFANHYTAHIVVRRMQRFHHDTCTPPTAHVER